MDIIIFAIVGVVVGLGIGFAIAKSLEKKKASGTIQEAENRARVTIVNSAPEVAEKAHAIAVLTEWDEFQELDWKSVYGNMLKPAFLFDGRRLLNRVEKEKIGFEFYAIGS